MTREQFIQKKKEALEEILHRLSIVIEELKEAKNLYDIFKNYCKFRSLKIEWHTVLSQPYPKFKKGAPIAAINNSQEFIITPTGKIPLPNENHNR